MVPSGPNESSWAGSPKVRLRARDTRLSDTNAQRANLDMVDGTAGDGVYSSKTGGSIVVEDVTTKVVLRKREREARGRASDEVGGAREA